MADDGYNTPTGKIIMRGTPPIQIEKKTASANVYPGRLVKKGTTDYDCDINDGISPVIGWAGYEMSDITERKESYATAWDSGDEIPIYRGGGFTIYGKLAPGFGVAQGDALIPWGSGYVAPAVFYKGNWCVKIPFTNSATVETDTGVDLPTGINVVDAWVKVTTLGATTIDVGILSTEAGGDADGFLDAQSVAVAGIPDRDDINDAEADLNLGVLLIQDVITDAAGTPLYIPVHQAHICDGTAVSISYTTPDVACAGDILLAVSYDGIDKVGQAGVTLASSSSAQDLPVESRL